MSSAIRFVTGDRRLARANLGDLHFMIGRIVRGAAMGAAAGAAGITALYVVTYTDMAIRGRSPSGAPASEIERLAEKADIAMPGDEDTRQNRLTAAGALAGIWVGVAIGAAYGVARASGLRLPVLAGAAATGLAAMAAADAPMMALGVSDPRTWGAADWASDVIPHAAYGAVTAACAAALTDGSHPASAASAGDSAGTRSARSA
jgi:hypothetical protein